MSTRVPAIGDGSTLSRSVYANASAEPASSARASAGGIQRRLTARRFYGRRAHPGARIRLRGRHAPGSTLSEMKRPFVRPRRPLSRHRPDRRARAANEPADRRGAVARRSHRGAVVAAGAPCPPARDRAPLRTPLTACHASSTSRSSSHDSAKAVSRTHARRASRTWSGWSCSAPRRSPSSPGSKRSGSRWARSLQCSRSLLPRRASAPAAPHTRSAID